MQRGTFTYKWTSVTFMPLPNNFTQCWWCQSQPHKYLCMSQHTRVFFKSEAGASGSFPAPVHLYQCVSRQRAKTGLPELKKGALTLTLQQLGAWWCHKNINSVLVISVTARRGQQKLCTVSLTVTVKMVCIYRWWCLSTVPLAHLDQVHQGFP